MHSSFSLSGYLQPGYTPSRKQEVSAVLRLSWPAILEQLMLTMIQYIDTAMVGSLGPQATASIGVTSSTIWLLNSLLGATAIGFSVQVAQYIGAGNYQQAKNVTRQSLAFTLLAGIFMAVAATALSFPLPGLLGAEPAIQQDASLYFRIVGLAMPFTQISVLLSSLFRSAGDTRTPMLFNILINCCNVVLNFLFIYPSRTIELLGRQWWIPGVGMGVPGAAVGSAISVAFVSVLFLIVLYRRKWNLQIHLRESYRMTKSCLRAMARIAAPQATARSALNLAQIVVTFMVTSLGTQAVAANSLAVTAEALCYQPGFGIAAAATALVGQAVGASRKDLALRFSKVCCWLGMGIMTGCGVLMFIFAEPLMSLFTPDGNVIALGAHVLRIEAFAEPLFAASIVVTGAFSGAGDTKWIFYINLISMWGIRLTLAALLLPVLGLSGVWVAMACELCVRGLLCIFRMNRGKWLHTGVIVTDQSSG